MWRALLRRLLVRLGVVQRPDVLARFVERHPTPEELPLGSLVIVQDGARQKWACLRCPGGCGAKLQLSLNPARRPCWKVAFDWLGRPSISPSIHQQNACRCHFWLKRGIVEWCAGSRTHR